MPLSPDDPARARIKELRAADASREEIIDAMETFSVDASYLVKAFSPGHAKLIVSDLVEHMIEAHLEPGTFALSSVQEPERIAWLDGPLFGGTLDG